MKDSVPIELPGSWANTKLVLQRTDSALGSGGCSPPTQDPRSCTCLSRGFHRPTTE